MNKNIMLVFLSDVKFDLIKPAERVGICNGKGQPANYVIKDINGMEHSIQTYTTNESAVRYMEYNLPNDEKIDKIFMFATKMVQSDIKAGYKEDAEWYIDAEGKKWTHLEYFKNRLKTVLKCDDDVFNDACTYDESSTPDKTLGMILAMAEQISRYAEQQKSLNSDVRIKLWADLTGGLRHANMLMLTVLRMLQYQGITIEKVLYSNLRRGKISTVEEATEIYKLFDLIGGAAEFARFGSVEVMCQYYKDRKVDAKLQKLLDAMKNFAEQIKLCHYGDFTDAVKELRLAKLDFDSHKSSENENSQLLHQMISGIEDKYKILLTKEPDDLELSEWCLDNEYIQQALTLYTERVPEYLLENNIVEQTTDEREKTIEKYRDDSLNRSINYCLLNEYKIDNEQINKYKLAVCAEVGKLLKEQFIVTERLSEETFNNKIGNVCKKYADIYPLINNSAELYMLLDEWHEVKIKPQWLKKEQLDAHKGLKKLVEYYVQAALDGNWEEYYKEDYGKKHYKAIKNYACSNMNMAEFMKGYDEGFVSRYPACGQLLGMLRNKIIYTRVPETELLNIYEEYDWVKRERVQTNHAKLEKADKSSRTLIDNMRKYLARLRKACELCNTVR